MAFFWQGTPKARLQRLWSTIVHSFYFDRAPADATLFISGSPRSGTTWLAEAINYDNSYRFIGEPFTFGQVPMSQAFALRQYLRPDDGDPRYLDPARKIFAGKIRNRWSDSPNHSTFPRRRLVKDVRTTMLLKWFRVHFPQLPIVYIMRHPFAVAASRIRLGYRTDMGPMYLRQAPLVADHLGPFVELINEPKSPFASHVLDWCVENFVPLRQLERGDVIWVFYERLTSIPEDLSKLFAALGEPVGEEFRARLNRPSMSTLAK